jgi:DNA-binding NarL/FixJ family response regulator
MRADHLSSSTNQSTSRRLRVLICACTSQEASEVFRSFEGAETMHIPSDDISELGAELKEFHPDFVLCGASFLYGLLSAGSVREHSHPSDSGRTSQTGKRLPLVKRPDVSARDFEVLQLLAKGAHNVDIARALNLTESSVKRILQRLYERFEAANRAELLGRVIELQLFAEIDAGALSG